MPNPVRVQAVDRKVGEAIRNRRKNLGLSQEDLAEAVKISPQQIWKYETGGSRISASKLYDVARALRVPIAYFFSGVDDEQFSLFAVEIEQKAGNLLRLSEGAELAEIFPLLEDPSVRRKVVELVRAIHASSPPK